MECVVEYKSETQIADTPQKNRESILRGDLGVSALRVFSLQFDQMKRAK